MNGRFRLVALLVCLLTFVVFLPATRAPFLSWDDSTNLVNNPDFRGFTWSYLKWMWTNHLMDHYVPITWMTFGVDYELWRTNSSGYHLTNILIHAANAGLFVLLALTLFRFAVPGSAGMAAGQLLAGATVAALFFGLHPLRVESVAWATERRDVLSGFFYLISLLAYLRRFRDSSTASPRKYYWYCLGAFALAILSKEITLTLPVVLVVLDIYPLRRLSGNIRDWFRPDARSVWTEKIPFFAISAVSAVATLSFGMRSHIVDSFAALGWMPRIAITLYGMAFYLLKTIVPMHLSVFYPISASKTDWSGLPFLASAAAIVSITAAAFVLRREFPALLAVWVVFAATLLPVGGIFHNGYQIAADRYTYLSCMGWALLAGAGAAWCWCAINNSRAASLGLCVLILGAFAALISQTRNQLSLWMNADNLWQHAIALEPSTLAYTMLGAQFQIEGDMLGALDNYRRASALSPDNALAHNDAGVVLLELRRFPEAIVEFQAALHLQPGMPEAHAGLGQGLMMVGRVDEGIRELREALNINPRAENVRIVLARALMLKENSRPQ